MDLEKIKVECSHERMHKVKGTEMTYDVCPDCCCTFNHVRNNQNQKVKEVREKLKKETKKALPEVETRLIYAPEYENKIFLADTLEFVKKLKDNSIDFCFTEIEVDKLTDCLLIQDVFEQLVQKITSKIFIRLNFKIQDYYLLYKLLNIRPFFTDIIFIKKNNVDIKNKILENSLDFILIINAISSDKEYKEISKKSLFRRLINEGNSLYYDHLQRMIIGTFSEKKKTWIDPFMKSGITAGACMKEGVYYIGCCNNEIDFENCSKKISGNIIMDEPTFTKSQGELNLI